MSKNVCFSVVSSLPLTLLYTFPGTFSIEFDYRVDIFLSGNHGFSQTQQTSNYIQKPESTASSEYYAEICDLDQEHSLKLSVACKKSMELFTLTNKLIRYFVLWEFD